MYFTLFGKVSKVTNKDLVCFAEGHTGYEGWARGLGRDSIPQPLLLSH